MKHGEYKICKKRAKTSWKKLIEEYKNKKQSGKMSISLSVPSCPNLNLVVFGKTGSGKAFFQIK